MKISAAVTEIVHAVPAALTQLAGHAVVSSARLFIAGGTLENNIVTVLLLISAVITIYLFVSTITRCRSEKKNVFILCLTGMLFYILGNFFEVTSTDVDGAFTGVKVMYVGACFMSPLFLMFVLDYCEANVRVWQRVLMTAVPFVNMILIWTTDSTGLIYKEFRYTADSTIHGLQIVTPGPLYYMVYAVSAVCIIISLVVVIRRHFVWGSRYRKSLLLLTLISVGPLIANIIYAVGTYILKSNLHGLNFTPYVIVCTSAIFYYAVLRYDFYDFSTRATSVTVNIIHDAVVFMDLDNNFSSANDAAGKLIPALLNLPKGKPVTGVEGWPVELADVRPDESGCVREISFTMESDTETRYYTARIKPVDISGRGVGTVLIIQDVTDTAMLMKKLENAAYTDSLTGLYNRRHFMDLAAIFLERAKRSCTPCSVMMFDLDLFKDVNDTYGHLAGDEVLRKVAGEVHQSIRSYDVLGRYGGEEFTVFMDGASLDAAKRSAERIRRRIEGLTICHADAEIKVTCSIGVAETPDGSEEIEVLLERADAALYCAKKDGRNLVRTAD